MDTELKFEDLSEWQQQAVQHLLQEFKNTVTCQPRQAGRTTVLKFVEQELNRIDRNYH